MPQHDTKPGDADDAGDTSAQTDATVNPQQDGPGSGDGAGSDPQHDGPSD